MNEENKKRKSFKIRPLSVKKEAVELLKSGQIPLAEIAKQFGVNPGTITQQWVRQVERGVDRLIGGYKMPTDEFRLKVVRTVLAGGLSIEEAAKQYGIVEPLTISKWIKKFNSEITLDTAMQPMSPSPKKRGRKPNLQPTNEQQTLEQALEDAKMKILALETMINIAEEQFKIDIRKKSGTKQSE